MATRDLSPDQHLAPGGVASLMLRVMLGTSGDEPIPIDRWISNYSPCMVTRINLASGYNGISWPSGGNNRLIIFIPPPGNTQTLTWKAIEADTGIAIHPAGPLILSLPATGYADAFGITAGGVVNNCLLIMI